jgi:hypothetical protein
MSSEISLLEAVVDRIEDSFAVLLLGPEEVKLELPVALLPEATEEGSILSVDFRINRDAIQRQRDKIESLLEDLKKKGE